MAAPVYLYDRILGTGRETDGPGLGSVNNPFPATGFYLYDTDGNLWNVTIDNTGHLITTFGEPAGGEIFGLWWFLPRTYSE